MINAATNSFSGAKIWGCFFHFRQAVWRNLQRHGLSERYIKYLDKAVKKGCCLLTLRFVPLHEAIENFETLKQLFTENKRPFIEDFEETWKGWSDQDPKQSRSHRVCTGHEKRLGNEMPRQTNRLSCSHPYFFKTWKKFCSIMD